MDQEKVNRTDEMEIDLRELFYLFRQKLLIIIAAFVVGGMLAGAATYFLIKPTYKASSLLYVVSASNNSVVNLADLQIGTNLTADYEELLLSRPMMESVIKNLKLESVSVNGLRGMLNITKAVPVFLKYPRQRAIPSCRRILPTRWQIWPSHGCRR